jgi:predicted esterase
MIPQAKVRTFYGEASRRSLLGDLEGAVASLSAGLDEGEWYNPEMLETDPGLKALRGMSEFARIRTECADRRSWRQHDARPQCLVLSPSSALWDQQTLLVLHDRGDSTRTFAEHWRPLVNEGWTLVIPQSSQAWDSAGWCWDDGVKARGEVLSHVEESRTRRGLDPSRMVVAGVSQGAPLAMEIAGETGMPWLCVIPSFPAGYDVTPLIAVPGHTRGFFLLGEDDPANARTRPLISTLEAAGAQLLTRVMGGAGHELRGDFSKYVSELLSSVYG